MYVMKLERPLHSSPMRVLLTGATGFLGAHLVEACVRRGWTVSALARPSSRTDHLQGVEVFRGRFADPETLKPAMEVDAIVHAAGGGMGDVASIYAANTQSTRNLIEVAPSTLRRFVLISSLAAHGPSGERPAVETDPPNPQSHYGKSKLAAERVALEAPFAVTALRPPALYGPGEFRMVDLFRAAERGVVPMVHAEGMLSMLSGADCAEAAARALEREHEPGVYFASERKPYTRREMAETIGEAVGKRVRVVPVPSLALRVIARSGISKVLTRDKARDATQKHQACDPSKLMAALDWETEYSFRAGARLAYRDYKERGWL